MTAHPRLDRSIPFWSLLAVSVASAAVGGWILADRLGTMAATLTDNTATGVEVYVGQSLAVVGAVLVGAGIVGVLLSLAVAAAASLRPATSEPVAEVLEIDEDDEVSPSDADDLDATEESAEPQAADAEPAPVR